MMKLALMRTTTGKEDPELPLLQRINETDNINQAIGSNSPETCLAYLMDLEKKGDPHLDPSHLTKLTDFYSRVFSTMPLGKHCKNESYARMLVRFAELYVIQDTKGAEDNFNVATTHCQDFAFVHIAHAQFELSQGNTKKSTWILQRAIELSAKPNDMLEAAMQNLTLGKAELLSSEDKENVPGLQTSGSSAMLSLSSAKKLLNNFLVPDTTDNINQIIGSNSPEACRMYLTKLEKRGNPQTDTNLLLKLKDSYSRVFSRLPLGMYSNSESYAKMLVRYAELKGIDDPDDARDNFIVARSNCKSFAFVHIAHAQFEVARAQVKKGTSILQKGLQVNAKPTELIETAMQKLKAGNYQFLPAEDRESLPGRFHLNVVNYAVCLGGGSAVALSNESIVIKGKRFLVLKMIGRGGSSKVYQVLDQRNQLFAVKYVNLEEADAQTVESYKNEIEHLNRLQQYSDQIIKLYDYEITNSYIYMLMECGNLDLSTWLRNRKTINPLERKLYWKNMLEAVQTIHKHGIVHCDLKPANFVIVNASLKLIDFGIANSIQPDVTSIMKDSQVGTLNYMPPEAIKDTSSQPGKASSKISTKGDVWSLGCIMYCMTYGKTPFQTITNQITKLHAIIDPTHEMEFPDIAEKDLLDVLKRCLVRNPRERISIAELLEHSYLKLQSQQQSPVPAPPDNNDLKRILNELAALQSPNSIARAANNLAKMCNSGRKLDAAGCVKSSSHLNWKM
uniref:Ttk protein kinase n=1 Tax=Oncorhynchus mykiss TaxID=8022 RepID=A0A8C7TF67_ONCMY